MDRSFIIELGVLCWSSSGQGIGEKVRITSFDAYEPTPQIVRKSYVKPADQLKADWRKYAIDSASRKQAVSQGRTDRVGNQPARSAAHGEAS